MDISSAIPIERRIWTIRGRRVMLDSDLAEIYGVRTKQLNQQVRRNAARFPADFAFRLNRSESAQLTRLRSQSVTLEKGNHFRHYPMVFTEHGAIMLAAVLDSPAAVKASIEVINAFVRLRSIIVEHDGLGREVAVLSRRVKRQEERLERVFKVLEEVVEVEAEPRRRIGFLQRKD